MRKSVCHTDFAWQTSPRSNSHSPHFSVLLVKIFIWLREGRERWWRKCACCLSQTTQMCISHIYWEWSCTCRLTEWLVIRSSCVPLSLFGGIRPPPKKDSSACLILYVSWLDSLSFKSAGRRATPLQPTTSWLFCWSVDRLTSSRDALWGCDGASWSCPWNMMKALGLFLDSWKHKWQLVVVPPWSWMTFISLGIAGLLLGPQVTDFVTQKGSSACSDFSQKGGWTDLPKVKQLLLTLVWPQWKKRLIIVKQIKVNVLSSGNMASDPWCFELSATYTVLLKSPLVSTQKTDKTCAALSSFVSRSQDLNKNVKSNFWEAMNCKLNIYSRGHLQPVALELHVALLLLYCGFLWLWKINKGYVI